MNGERVMRLRGGMDEWMKMGNGLGEEWIGENVQQEQWMVEVCVKRVYLHAIRWRKVKLGKTNRMFS